MYKEISLVKKYVDLSKQNCWGQAIKANVIQAAHKQDNPKIISNILKYFLTNSYSTTIDHYSISLAKISSS